MSFPSRVLVVVIAVFGSGATAFSQTPKLATVPLILEDNRVFVELTFRKADGSPRKARAWVDTGGGSVLLTERLVDDLGLARTGPETSSDDGRMAPLSKPSVFLDTLSLDVSSAPAAHGIGGVFVILGSQRIAPGIDAEAFLPARVLMRYHAVFDYPARTFTLAMPGVLPPQGERVPASINTETGFLRIELTIDGRPYGFLLDTGAAYTMLSRELLEKWAAAHQDWPRLTGAVAEANMLDDQTDVDALLLRLPHVQWGSIEMRNVGTVSRRPGTFETYMTRLMSGPVVGAIAGNVLRTLRVDIDYPNGAAYIEKVREVDSHDLDSVGLVLGIANDGTYRVTGIARQDNHDVIEGMRSGDQLISVDGMAVTGASRDRVIRSLQGRSGERRKLRLRRDERDFEAEAAVRHLL
jgi:predicted aspartyl protease